MQNKKSTFRITKLLKLTFTKNNLRKKFVNELRKNGLKKAIHKVIKKVSEFTSVKTFTTPHYLKKDLFDFLFVQTKKSDTYIHYSEPLQSLNETDLKLIAFYLPQFHPIPQNDTTWGKGFTEWTNVSKAIPQFYGHHQPKLPGELGFYDLRLIENQKRQIELAQAYGIHGFCYHHYWFNGERIMDQPIEQLLAHPELDFPFCINWANENWTRRWDGCDSDILLAQKHSDEDDLAFIADAARYLKDHRYIRVDGKPLLMLYRPSLLPDAKTTALRWREWCIKNGIGEIYLVLTHSFDSIDPYTIGFDAAVEFAPNNFQLSDVTKAMESYIINPDYEGKIYDYESAIEISQNYQIPSYPKFRGICPGWDNEARKPGKGTTLIGSTPKKYREWLENLCTFTRENFKSSEQFIFINAWNEWAEGAYLEPDRKCGYGYLEATRDAITKHGDE